MAVCVPSGRGQHGHDGDRDGAGPHGEAAAGSNDRTSGSTALPARTARPGKRRRAASPSRRLPADHPPLAAVNRDASLFLRASPRLAGPQRRRRSRSLVLPDTAPSARHASADLAGFAASADPRRTASGGAPLPSNRWRSRLGRGRSGGTRSRRSRTQDRSTGGQTPRRTARHRSGGVDERRPQQDTSPACVLPGTVWGAAPGQNCQVPSGAVPSRNSASRPPACRETRRRRLNRPSTASTAIVAAAPDAAPAPVHAQGRKAPPTTIAATIGLKSVGQFK